MRNKQNLQSIVTILFHILVISHKNTRILILTHHELGKMKMQSKNLFAKIALVGEILSLNLRLVFKFPLVGPPQSLAEPIGTLKKTSKAALMHKRNEN